MRRAWAIAILIVIVAGGAAGAQAGRAASGRCARALPHARAGLPAAVIVTNDCGRFRLRRDGSVLYEGPRKRPVPAGAGYWPDDLTWWSFSRGHIRIGRGMKQLWRSRDRYRDNLGTIVLGRRRLAFSYYASLNGAPRLYLAGYRGRERLVATGETPIALAPSGGLVTWRKSGRALVLRTAGGRLERVVAAGVADATRWDLKSDALAFRKGDDLSVFDGVRVRRLARLRDLGLGRDPALERLGGILAVHSRRRLVVLDYEGRRIASTALPKNVSSIGANGKGTAVAFTYTSGPRDRVYVLTEGETRAREVLTEKPGQQNGCGRAAFVVWRGDQLLYSNTEQQAAIIDASGRRPPVKLDHVIARLPGFRTDGDGFFDISWA